MKILEINQPRQHGQPINSAPLVAQLSAHNVASVYLHNGAVNNDCVDIAFTPEHDNTIYVFAVTTLGTTHYVWADDMGNAGLTTVRVSA